MKVVKYRMKATLTLGDKETTIERTYRHKVNAVKFIKEMGEKYKAKCRPLNNSENIYTTICEGNKTKISFEIKREKILKPKKEDQKKKEESNKKTS
ncbi:MULTISPECIES: hypothetical protein [Acidianus]|uniref:Uncharacterized protein n=1 Tax=Candidatus Acidianus copahuensis TaxID=1160895 RepID=A0A031LKA5_9CREN|nr:MULTISPECIES: hypothetical protein [Acidianus]EZQ01905.1 hypothetical protein CM19_11795 [Candidatus Acidianus copahuensis]NON63507.1 hypothetical protein [Acidianus sp. RZ1]